MSAGPAPETPRVELHDEVAIPQLGFGVFQVPPEETQAAVEEALAVGYRHIDTAQAYGNEESVGRGLRASGVQREEIFVTTKFFTRRNEADAEAEKSLRRLGLDYVSCSPYRVTLARLAAAQAALKDSGIEAVAVGG